ncbi:MAG: hypothetical protein U0172_02105 [Nitrospiraceae bacterium]
MAAAEQPIRRAASAAIRWHRFAAYVALCFLPLLGLSAPSRADEPTAVSTLRDNLWAYIDSRDSQDAAAVLETILADPQAAVETVSAIFRTGRPYTSQPTGRQPHVPIAVRGEQYHYSLAVPDTYDPKKSYALVLCLHGAGFTGEAYLDRWRDRLGDRYILTCPTYSMGAWWTRTAEELALATIGDVTRRYSVDPDRVFLTGMSNGGIGAWIIGMHHADRFAGLAPMASGIDDVMFPLLANLSQTPTYVIHGAKDQVMPVRLSRAVTEALQRLDAPVVYREHEREHPMAGGHYFPKEELPDLVAWFDAQRRHAATDHVTLVRDATHLFPMDWVRIDTTDRIAAFADNLVEGSDEYIRGKVYAKLMAKRTAPNRIDVAATRVQRFTLFFTQDMIDRLTTHDRTTPLVVSVNGTVVHEGPITSSLDTMLKQARQRSDTSRLYPSYLSLTVPTTPVSPTP